MTLAIGLIASETRQVETAAQNIANLSTPGYKRQITFADALGQADPSSPLAALSPIRSPAATDFTPGKMIHTGSPFDLALAGGGFFQVATEDGIAYLRGGAFRPDATGRLVTPQGWALQRADGGDVVVRSSNWHVEPDGTVVDNGNPVAVIGTVSFRDPSALMRAGNGRYLANGAPPDDLADPRIVQGFLEASNVSNGDEMVRMMEAMRRVESGQKLVHAYDDMMSAALQRMGGM
ncbi:flagellar hook-basal body protein [Burkholderia ambifaria]|uniref:flagellar hook-basal body protein n=1 Tax=Burkholderia ambifaria TaxID=152480 RepID=UPI001FC830C4|nr:flagellar hook-basal body protein [Burkholderia ambifaria]